MTADFMHVGLTVLELERTIAFYSKWLGFRKVSTLRFPPEFFADEKALYELPEGVFCDMAMIESEDRRCVLELFQFSNTLPGGGAPWRETGIHHLAFKVPNIPELYEKMKAAGVPFYFAPKTRGPVGDAHWIFFNDPDGNKLELWD